MSEQELIALVTEYGDERAKIIIAGNLNLPEDTERAQTAFDLIVAEVRRLTADVDTLKHYLALERHDNSRLYIEKDRLTAENARLTECLALYQANERKAIETLEASEKVCKIISEYMRSGEFFDPETSKAIYEWQALKGNGGTS